MDYTKEFLGHGLAFPVRADDSTGEFLLSHYEKDIEEAIRIILYTRCGERVMRPEFGSNIHEFLFAAPSYTVENQIKNEVERCLTLWEPRIVDLEVSIEFLNEHSGGFNINLSYMVRDTNSIFNLVFPYYLTEGNS